MTDRIKRMKVGKRDAGFTLIELLVVITILGILAAIVVFSVGGIQDKGQTSACKTDTETIQTAEEANFARTGTVNTVAGGQYVTSADLVKAGLLSTASTLHSAVVTGAGYDIKELQPKDTTAPAGAATCGGNVGDVVLSTAGTPVVAGTT
jgi:general secretion pathway protein G